MGMEENSKHLKFEARQARFEKRRQYGGASATLKRSTLYREHRETQLEVIRPENEDFLVMRTEIDDLYHLPVNGHHGLAADELEEFLEYLSEIYAPQESFDKSGKKVTIFRVPATGWEMGKHSAARQKARFDRLQLGEGGTWTLEHSTYHTFYRQTMACKIMARILDTPLDSIVDPSLLDKHSLSCSASSKGTRPESAHINNNCASSCWSPPLMDLGSHYLQVDLNCNCEVTYISTQGRFPPLLKSPYNSICRFTGAQIMDKQNSEMRQWVWKYEVTARVDSGRTWFSLGVFDGNRDMTTEVAHKLFSPIKCRYLRFYVLGYDRVPAMRVGVYGLRPGGVAQKKVIEKHAVEYKFERIVQDMCLDRVPVGSRSAEVSHGYHCPHCKNYTGGCMGGRCSCKKRHRHLRRLSARKLVPEALALLHSKSLPDTFVKPGVLADLSPQTKIPTESINKGTPYLCSGDEHSVGLSRLSVSDLRRADFENEISAEWILI